MLPMEAAVELMDSLGFLDGIFFHEDASPKAFPPEWMSDTCD